MRVAQELRARILSETPSVALRAVTLFACVLLPAGGDWLLALTDIGGPRTTLVFGPPVLLMSAVLAWVAIGSPAGRHPALAGVWLFGLVLALANGLVLVLIGLAGFGFGIGVDPALALTGLLPLVTIPAAVVSALHLRRELCAFTRAPRRAVHALVAASAAVGLAVVPWAVHEIALGRGWRFADALRSGDPAGRVLTARRFRPFAWCVGIPAASIAAELGPVPHRPDESFATLPALEIRLERAQPKLAVFAGVAPLLDERLSR